MKSRFVLGLAGLALAVLALGAVPAQAAPAKNKVHKTALFTLPLPATFALQKSSATNWTFKSQNGHYVLGITAYPMTKKPLAEIGEKVLKSFLKDGKKAEILKKETTKEDGRDIFYAVVKSTRTYGKVTRLYTTMRVLTQSTGLRKLVSISLSVSGDRAGEFEKLAEHVMDNLKFAKAK